MKMNDLRAGEGEISRSGFLAWGLLLFCLKYGVDLFVMQYLFAHPWHLSAYFEQPLPGAKELSPLANFPEFIVMLGLSLPFLWAGLVLSLKRLRSAHLPLWLVVLFVMPILKWVLFLLLLLVPGALGKPQTVPPPLRKPRAPGWLPTSTVGSAAIAVLASALLAVVGVALGTTVLASYGWALFIGVPFCMGFLGSVVHGAKEPRTLTQNLQVAAVSLVIAAGAILVVAFEGVVCILMAAPLAATLAAIGALIGHAVQPSRCLGRPASQLYCIPLLGLPLMFGTEHFRADPSPLLKVTSSIEVNATPERVWRNVISFGELPPPHEALFRYGIAYPIRARIQGSGVGAVRYCEFSTGPFIEPIEVWDQPRLLKFSVTNNPAPMREWSFYRDLHPAHLDHFLVSRQGQFRLSPLPGGRTLLEGTTWYHHNMWPVRYWQLWSDHIIHAIHLRVLRHVKELSEKSPGLERPTAEKH